MNIILAIAYATVLTVVASFVAGLWLMTLVGIIHNEWIPAFPTIGYTTAVTISFMLYTGRAIGLARKKAREWRKALRCCSDGTSHPELTSERAV